MSKHLPIWLIAFIAGMSRVSESIYSPSLPEIAIYFATNASMVEYTITVFLIGFALGSLFWGRLSDIHGRKKCLIIGFSLFLIACIGCYFAKNIYHLMFFRIVQAFGCSVSSVISQAICRDIFKGQELSKVFSTVAASLTIFAAISPVIGGIISQYYGWRSVFIFLVIFVSFTLICIFLILPETHFPIKEKQKKALETALRMIKDKKIIKATFIIGGCNGIIFSTMAEGPFYFINYFNVSASHYGKLMLIMASASFIGSLVSRKLNDSHENEQLVKYGLKIMLYVNILFALFISLSEILKIKNNLIIYVSLFLMCCSNFGMALATINALSNALIEYKDVTGTASSFFSFSYYVIISLCTLIMGLIHNGTAIMMPCYFVVILVFLNIITKKQE